MFSLLFPLHFPQTKRQYCEYGGITQRPPKWCHLTKTIEVKFVFEASEIITSCCIILKKSILFSDIFTGGDSVSLILYFCILQCSFLLSPYLTLVVILKVKEISSLKALPRLLFLWPWTVESILAILSRSWSQTKMCLICDDKKSCSIDNQWEAASVACKDICLCLNPNTFHPNCRTSFE